MNQAIEKRYLDRRLMFALLDRLFPDNYMVDVREREMSLFGSLFVFCIAGAEQIYIMHLGMEYADRFALAGAAENYRNSRSRPC